jgi:hypothetical protein
MLRPLLTRSPETHPRPPCSWPTFHSPLMMLA